MPPRSRRLAIAPTVKATGPKPSAVSSMGMPAMWANIRPVPSHIYLSTARYIKRRLQLKEVGAAWPKGGQACAVELGAYARGPRRPLRLGDELLGKERADAWSTCARSRNIGSLQPGSPGG